MTNYKGGVIKTKGGGLNEEEDGEKGETDSQNQRDSRKRTRTNKRNVRHARRSATKWRWQAACRRSVAVSERARAPHATAARERPMGIDVTSASRSNLTRTEPTQPGTDGSKWRQRAEPV